MHAAAPEPALPASAPASALLWLLSALLAAPAQASEAPERICEYRTLDVDPQTGDIRFIAPVKTSHEDCSDIGAAMADLDPLWRQKLPPRVRWAQQSDALDFCQSQKTPLGQRMLVLPEQGCVLLQAREACTIVTAQALSHAQLANAVRSCVP